MKINKFTLYYTFFILNFILTFGGSINAAPFYSPTIEISNTSTSKRSVGEVDIMIPLFLKNSNLSILDIKIKKDNHESLEGNLGLVNRTNIKDRAILGLYAYFDRRRTKSYLTLNQLTLGAEILSPNLDLRVNAYLPQIKQKAVIPANKKFVRSGTRVYVTEQQEIKEAALKGFDCEVGIPLFLMQPSLNEKYGTRIYFAKYNFSKRKVGTNSGMRFRLEQKINFDLFDKKDVELTLNLGSSREKKKYNNFFALGMKVALNKNYQKTQLTKMERRMMDTVIRDIDIVMQRSAPEVNILPLYWRGKEVKNLYFVGEKNDEGDGSYENPFSKTQLDNLIFENKFKPTEYDMILPVTTADSYLTSVITFSEYKRLLNSCNALGLEKNEPIELQTSDKTSFIIENIPEYFSDFLAKKVEISNPELNSFFNEAFGAMEEIDKNFQSSKAEVVFMEQSEYSNYVSSNILSDSQWVVVVSNNDEPHEELTKLEAAKSKVANFKLNQRNNESTENDNLEGSRANNSGLRYNLTHPSLTEEIRNNIREGNTNTRQKYVFSPGKVSLTQLIRRSFEEGRPPSSRLQYILSPGKTSLTNSIRARLKNSSMQDSLVRRIIF